MKLFHSLNHAFLWHWRCLFVVFIVAAATADAFKQTIYQPKKAFSKHKQQKQQSKATNSPTHRTLTHLKWQQSPRLRRSQCHSRSQTVS